ncbi:hypothetical protein [Streptomyces lydicus]|uniref:hypothetical protein n=1 Tax=Streptomyces lydicus TaxID=47763 RepID=UPI0036A95909
MRKSMDRTGRGVVCAPASLALSAALTPASAAPAPGESARIPFGERFHVTRHGGIARAANAAISCGRSGSRAAASCAAARHGGAGTNGRYRTTYIDVDSDRRTDNSSMLIAAPGGRYRALRADTLTGRRTTSATDGYQASADVTRLVRRSGAGACTVAQIDAAAGRSRAGARGGWTLVAVYENKKEPLRRLALWDGFERPGRARRALSVRMQELRIPAHSHGRVGVVAYDGDRGRGKERLLVRADGRHPYALHDDANPSRDVMNSTITELGRESVRKPAYRNTLGLDSDVFDLSPALRSGADRLNFRFTARKRGYLLGAFFVQADTRR